VLSMSSIGLNVCSEVSNTSGVVADDVLQFRMCEAEFGPFDSIA
jgi:hypothetical protein